MHPLLSFSKTAYIETHDLKPLLGIYTNTDDHFTHAQKINVFCVC